MADDQDYQHRFITYVFRVLLMDALDCSARGDSDGVARVERAVKQLARAYRGRKKDD